MTESINNSRREFLFRLSKPVHQLNNDIEVTLRHAPRPPRAVDEALFIRLCDNCGECQQVCPNSVIEMDQGLAKLNLDYNECSLCEECVKACPTGALSNSIAINNNLRPSFSQSCNNYMDIECQHCIASCPESALTIEDGEIPALNNDRCNGCGQCRSSCFIGAISMKFQA